MLLAAADSEVGDALWQLRSVSNALCSVLHYVALSCSGQSPTADMSLWGYGCRGCLLPPHVGHYVCAQYVCVPSMRVPTMCVSGAQWRRT